MTFAIALSWWVFPTVVTLLGLIWALFLVKDNAGYGSGLGHVFAVAIAGLVSTLAWMIAGIFK